ncbi:CoA transferase [Rhodobacterales bacterium HKCCE2091]|nr:CoA transferase [Rhodobacterales bacterium HKCCE2091]
MTGALDGLRIIDLTQNLAGPFCSMNLADHGADVIKVEPPGGEGTRQVAPLVNGESTPFMMWNRNKRSLVLDLKQPDDREVLLGLLRDADILMESFRPGVMDRLGFGWDTMHDRFPRLIYGSISGYGPTGPLGRHGGFDVMAQGMSGLMSVNGPKDGPPHRLPIPFCDLAAGLFMTTGLLTAVEARHRTGRGQLVETSLLEAATAMQHYEANHFFVTGEAPPRVGQAHRGVAPYQLLPTADGHMTVGAGMQKAYAALCRVAGREDLVDDPRFRTVPDRVENLDALIGILSDETARHPTGWWIERLDAAGVPCGPVLDHAQLLTHPQIEARRMVEEIDHPRAGRLKALGIPVKLSDTPGSIRRHAPSLGEHDAELRAEAAERTGVRASSPSRRRPGSPPR